MRQSSKAGLIAAGLMITGLWIAGCASAPEAPKERDTNPTRLAVGEAVTDVEIKTGRIPHHYTFTLDREGLLMVTLTWRHPDGVDRMVVHGGGGLVKGTALGFDRLQTSHTTTARRGQYYIEVVPGRYPTTYDLKVELSANN
ncbi:MAG: hypothetical protein CMH57_10770 [Myxococcales bacterium]|nr:hypothetical protein [Myxococcales bacterium]